jgi:hypothetical protein
MRPLFLASYILLFANPGDALARPAYHLDEAEIRSLAGQVHQALELPISTVTDKTVPLPGGDIHDYVSYARYYWPDPDKPGGLPYIARDGHHNHEQVARGDHARLWNFFNTVEILAAGWHANGDERAARRAGEWLRAWLVTPSTRMNPHLEYAQVQLGHNNNRGSNYGVIDARGFGQVIDALLLLHDSPAFKPGDEAAIKEWFVEYLHWLTTAGNAVAERAMRSNHGSWYLAQAVPIARHVGRDDLARALCEEAKALIAEQISADGSNPREIRRVNGLGYSVFNLKAHARTARLAAGLGIDLWNHTAPNGASLRRAVDFLRPYNQAPGTWPHSQSARLDPGFLDELVKEMESAAQKSLREIARAQFTFAALQYRGLLKRMEGDASRQPRSVLNGHVVAAGPLDWTSGFFPGSLWLIYEQTNNPDFRAAAEDFTGRLKSVRTFTGHHDVGFMLGCSYGEGWRITHDPAYRDVLIQGARSQAARFSPATGLIRSWDNGPWGYPVIIDNMMNLGLLWFAYIETGEEQFRAIVMSHADKTQANHFRPDESSFHLVDYAPDTGAAKKRQTVQGHADDSAWARGQAWGIAGYAAAARYAKNPAYLSRAVKIADFIRAHPRLPDDGIPCWDFDAPDIPGAPRDASAGAIMAVGMLDLAQQLGAEKGAPYREFAEKQIRSLAGPVYRAPLNENGNFLLMHSVGNHPKDREVDVPLNYADYYFLKALSIVLGGEFATAGVP